MIPANQITVAEVVMNGIAAAAGSTAVNIANVYHFRRTTTVNVPSKSVLETRFQAIIGAPVIALLNARYAQTNTTIRWVNDPLDQALPFTEAGVGAIAGDSMSSLDAVYVLMRTGIKGRSYRGSKHYGPLSEADTTATSDILNAAAIARFATLIAALAAPFTDANGNTWVLQVYSRTLDAFAVKPIVASFDVSSVLLNKRVGRMKRREAKSVY